MRYFFCFFEGFFINSAKAFLFIFKLLFFGWLGVWRWCETRPYVWFFFKKKSVQCFSKFIFYVSTCYTKNKWFSSYYMGKIKKNQPRLSIFLKFNNCTLQIHVDFIYYCNCLGYYDSLYAKLYGLKFSLYY